jgi:hypothetical protein
VSIVYTVTAAVSVGLMSVSIFGVDLLEPLTTIEVGPGFTIDYATLGSIAALGTVWWVNRPQFGRLDGTYQLLLAATVGLVAWGAYEPQFLADQNELIQMAAVGIQMGGYWAIGQN